LEEGQVKMQSRLEEEEEAKAALMSRIQRLTKLILVSSKSTLAGYKNDMPCHQRSLSASGDDASFPSFRSLKYIYHLLKLDVEIPKDSPSSALSGASEAFDFKHRRSFSKWNDDKSQSRCAITDSSHPGDLICGSSFVSKMPLDGGVTMSDQIDLMVEQVKMLNGEIALSTSTLKRLVEQMADDPENSKPQIENLEHEINAKRKQIRILERQIVECREASVADASMVEMQQTVMKLMAQCSEKGFELEIKTADNRILQDQLENQVRKKKK
ncbi:hypothetical protein M569_11843, partial [Genlisea aurea]